MFDTNPSIWPLNQPIPKIEALVCWINNYISCGHVLGLFNFNISVNCETSLNMIHEHDHSKIINLIKVGSSLKKLFTKVNLS